MGRIGLANARQQDMQDGILHYGLTGKILKCAFKIAAKLGSGFLESVYKKALLIALQKEGFSVEVEKAFTVFYEDQAVGLFYADLIVEEAVIIEVKACETLIPEHQAQLINYLSASGLPVGLLINLGRRRVQYHRVSHPAYPAGER